MRVSGRVPRNCVNCAQVGEAERENGHAEGGDSHKLQCRREELGSLVLSLVARCGGQEHPALLCSEATKLLPLRRHRMPFGSISTFRMKMQKLWHGGAQNSVGATRAQTNLPELTSLTSHFIVACL